jgi:hypothetical protein
MIWDDVHARQRVGSLTASYPRSSLSRAACVMR